MSAAASEGASARTFLVLGPNGQVGRELLHALAPLGRVVAADRTRADLSVPDSLRAVIREVRPDVVVNAAAYTAVDRAESEPQAARAVNGIAPGVLAEECARTDALLVHYSTDYVFAGDARRPYREDDPTGPLGVYGRTKLDGEEAVRASGAAHLILRTGWVYGLRGHNFLRTVLALAAGRDELRVVDDQAGAPTWSRHVAAATAMILAHPTAGLRERSGVYHLTAAGETSRWGFASAIVGRVRPGVRVVPIATGEHPAAAPRPAYSVLDSTRLQQAFGIRLPAWRETLETMLREAAELPAPLGPREPDGLPS